MDRMKDILEKIAKQNAASLPSSGQPAASADAKIGNSARARKPADSRRAPRGPATAGTATRPSTRSPKAEPNTETAPQRSDASPAGQGRAARLRAIPPTREQPISQTQMPTKRARPVPTPVPDMDSDRILELPTRRKVPDTSPPHAPRLVEIRAETPALKVELVRPALPRNSMSDGREPHNSSPSGFEPIGNSMQGFLERLAERRKRRALTGDHPLDTYSAPVQQTPPCPHCGGAGYLRLDVPVGHPSFGQPVPCECRERELEARRKMEEERRLLELDRFFSLNPFKDKTFTTFNANAAGVSEAYNAARKFADDPAGAQNRWLVLLGAPGTGKTHLAAAIANYRLHAGSSVFFAVVPDLLDHLRAAFAPSSEVPYNEMFETIREVELLVLDDLGAQNSTAWATEKLFQLINHRYNYRMPTVITTNIQAFQRLDERIASRLSDPTLARSLVIETSSRRPRVNPKSPPRW